MDRGKKTHKFFENRNNKIYMELKDIIREHALPFLPAKSLFRCFGVCREWKLQISTPFFAHNQSNSFHAISGFFLQSQTNLPSFVSLDQMAYGVPDPSLSFLPEPVDIRTSSNGLLCCQGRTGYNAYYICNPATKQWKKLPRPEADHGSDPAVVLIFEPSLLNFVATYTLVCAFPSELDGYEFEIYSSRDGSWRVSGEICFGDRKIVPRSGVHVNGIVYWQAKYGKIMAFDLQRERSQLLYSDNGTTSLGVMNGKLCSGWVRGPKLGINVLSNAYTNTMQMYSPIRAWESKLHVDLDTTVYSHGHGAVLFLGDDMMVIQAGASVFSYDLKSKRMTCLPVEFDNGKRLVAYVNSLVEI